MTPRAQEPSSQTSSPASPALIGGRCRACEQIAFPRRLVCARCSGRELDPCPLNPQGKLAAFTVAWAAPAGFDPPLVQGWVDLSEDIRLLSIIEGVDPREPRLKIGQLMELVVESGGASGYRCRPVE